MLARLTLLLPLLAVLAGAAPPDPAGTDGHIQRLGSPKFAEREAASRALEALGEPALTALRKAAKTAPDLEVRRRAATIVERIDHRLLVARVERIKASKLGPAQKGRELRPFVVVGMTREQVRRLLGPGKELRVMSKGEALASPPIDGIAWYRPYGLNVCYKGDVVVHVGVRAE